MALKLMFITNRPDVAIVAEQAGVDRIVIDMEYIGKDARQGGMDSVKNHHTINDIRVVRNALTKAELVVRVNPIHKASASYCSSEEEIHQAINAGADIIMLPFFKTVEEIQEFISIVNGRAKTLLLLETPEAVELVDKILAISGIDEIHLGINDMSIGYNKDFMFELLADGTVEKLCIKLKMAGIPYGFGGVASIGSGLLPAEMILKEHYRLGSSMVILSRSFCNVSEEADISIIQEKFDIGVRCLRAFEKEIAVHSNYFLENENKLVKTVLDIARQIRQSRANNTGYKENE